jgi:uncharacterized protein YecT (DUF1311 family)
MGFAIMRLTLAAITILSLAVAPAMADDPAADFQNADKALNQTFKDIERRLADDANGKHRLVAAQRAWIAFRDAECSFQSSGEDGGTAAPEVALICRTALTTDRVEQLKAYLNCEEGDLSCPVPAE